MLSAGYLTTEELRARLLPSAAQDQTGYDATIAALGKATAERLNRWCNRRLERTVDAVDRLNAMSMSHALRCYPVESVDAVELVEADGTRTDSEVEYQLDAAAGLVEFLTVPGGTELALEITHTGGYWLDDGGAMPAGATAMPADLLEAFVSQCQATAEARGLFEAVAMRDAKERPQARPGLEPDVEEALMPYRRF